MTLDTRIAIGGGAVNVREIFGICAAMVNTPAGTEPRTDPFIGKGPGVKHLYNPGGIGADAWLITWYGVDGPIPPHACDDDCYLDDPDDYPGQPLCMDARSRDEGDPRESGWASMMLSFDTAYSYRDSEGRGCNDLHRSYIEVLHAYTQRKGLLFKWQNEYTGEWHDGLDGLDEFAQGGRDADAWFRGSVLPAIAAHLNHGGVS